MTEKIVTDVLVVGEGAAGQGPDGNPHDHDRLTGEMIYSTFVHRKWCRGANQ